jgi:cation:H+ antiporter
VAPGQPGRLVGIRQLQEGACPVPVAAELSVFLAAAAVSLSASYLVVTRLERIGERLGLSEALLGVLAALAGDAPEITAAVTALRMHQNKVGAGVIIGSNVFNLAALLGLGAVVAGRIALHRRVILLGGVVGVWMAVVCLVMVLGLIPAGAALVAALAALIPYLIVLGAGRARLARIPLARRWAAWLAAAVSEEEAELEEVIRPAHGRARDVAVAGAMLVVVVVASVAMEQAATRLGTRFAIPPIIIGGVVLAAVTSLPNSVAAVYLAARGRGAAMLSTTLNSNALNVTAGLLVPAAIIGLGAPSGQADLIAVWYLVLTLIALAFAYRYSGMARTTGAFIIGAYLVFVGSLWIVAHSAEPGLAGSIVPLAFVVVCSGAGLARRPRRLR